MSGSSDLGALGGWLAGPSDGLGIDAAPGLSPLSNATYKQEVAKWQAMAQQEEAGQKAEQFQREMLRGMLRYPTTTTSTSKTITTGTSGNLVVRLVDGQPPQGPEPPEHWLRRRVAEVQWRPA